MRTTMQTQGKDATTRRLMDQIELMRVVINAARASINNPAWSGVCDEDVELERAIREYERICAAYSYLP
jgi:hypothetical protein